MPQTLVCAVFSQWIRNTRIIWADLAASMFTDGQGKGLSDKSRVTTNFQKPAACRFFVSPSLHYWVDMRILLSNDDGYLAPGLAQLAGSLEGLGEITVVAP